jgi:Mrp family chromosome partitioning ATPase
MSKIFDAYKKVAGETPDMAMEVGRAGAPALFPAPDGAQGSEFSKLANHLLSFKGEGRGVILAFASSAAGEGASFVSYNAALTLATSYRQRVAWIDGNFVSPQKKLRRHSGPATLCSLVAAPDSVPGLVLDENPLLLPGGGTAAEIQGHLASPGFSQMLQRMSELFDFTILDLPPILSSADSALMGAHADGLLLVVERKFLKTEVIEHGLRDLREKGVRVLGTVINRRTFDLPKFIYDRL